MRRASTVTLKTLERSKLVRRSEVVIPDDDTVGAFMDAFWKVVERIPPYWRHTATVSYGKAFEVLWSEPETLQELESRLASMGEGQD